MRTKSTFLAQNALASPTLAEGSNLGKGPRLQIPAQWWQSRLRLAPMNLVTGWMPVQTARTRSMARRIARGDDDEEAKHPAFDVGYRNAARKYRTVLGRTKQRWIRREQ